MNALRTVQYLLNRLLPFTTPGTPLVQDLVHTFALCTFLYFAPHILENRANRQQDLAADIHDGNAIPDAAPPPRADAQLDSEDEDLEADDGEDIDGFPHAQAGAPFQAHVEDEPLPEDGNLENDGGAHAQPGPADAAQRRASQQTRQVGAKKAKSLARRDQRRAYHEFMRSQGEQQRAREAEGAEEREAELFEEKRRRAVAEAALEERARAEREAKRERERKAREEELKVQKEALGLVRSGLEERGGVELEEVVRKVGRKGEGREWLERLVRADGIVGAGKRQDGSVRMITTGGWVVRIGEEDMAAAWRAVAERQTVKISYADLGEALEGVVKRRIKA